MGGRVRELRGRRRWPPGRSARYTGPRSRAASAWWSRCSGRPPSRRSCRTWRCCGCSSSGRASAGAVAADRRPAGGFDHLSTSLQRELDFTSEAEALERHARDRCAPFDRLAVPRVHGELSSRRLLVMEEVRASRSARRRRARAGGGRRASSCEAFLQQVLRRRVLPRRPAPGQPALGRRRVVFCSTWGWSASSTCAPRELAAPDAARVLARRRRRSSPSCWCMLATDTPDDVDLAALGAEVEVRSPATGTRRCPRSSSARCCRT